MTHERFCPALPPGECLLYCLFIADRFVLPCSSPPSSSESYCGAQLLAHASSAHRGIRGRTAVVRMHLIKLTSLTQGLKQQQGLSGSGDSSPSVQLQPVSKKPAKTAKPEKTLNDVIAGSLARAGSQTTIHPIDTIKVRMQAGPKPDQTPSGTCVRRRVCV